MATSLGIGGQIVTDGLVLCLDAANKDSYPGSGTTWSDLAGSNNGTLTNGPTFDSGNGGSLVFDGVNDTVTMGSSSTRTNLGITSYFTFDIWINAIDEGDSLASLDILPTGAIP